MKYFIFVFLLSTCLFPAAQAMSYAQESDRQVDFARPLSPIPNNEAQFIRWLEKAFALLDDTAYFKRCMQNIIEKIDDPDFFETYRSFILSLTEDHSRKCLNFIATQKKEKWEKLTFYLNPAFMQLLTENK